MFNIFKRKPTKNIPPVPSDTDPELRQEFISELESAAHKKVNAIDAALVMMHAGKATIPHLFSALETTPLYNLIKSKDTNNKPLILIHPKGYGTLATFSSPERAERTIQQFPEFKEMIEIRLTDILNILSDDTGITINPQYRVAYFNMDPAQVKQMKEIIQKTS